MTNVYSTLEFYEIINQIKEYCAFSLGEEAILNIKPSNNRLEVHKRLALSKEVMSLINEASEYELVFANDVSFELEKSEKDMTLSGFDLIKIANLNLTSKTIINNVKNSELEIDNLRDLVSTLTLVDDLEKQIKSSINNYGEVLDSASVVLKQLRNDSIKLNSDFNNTIKRFMESNNSILADSIEYERNNRKVVLINSNYKNKVKGVIHGESKSGQSVYFEPNSFITFNNERSSIAHLIMQEEEKVLFQISQMVKADALILKANLKTLGHLDMILAIAKWGSHNEAVIADISDDQSIYLEQVAHPLIAKELVVRNTYNLSDKATLIVSGPNTGGKTVTLKTIGLSILMSMCGIPVIANYAKLPIVDKIFVDLGDMQSVVAALSTFSSHLTRLSDIIESVSENSLVILDELGSGTDPKEGEAFAIAIIEYLKSKNTITLITTHLSGLKQYAQSNDNITLASVEFDQNTLSPTYRYVEGLAGQSNALEIAQKFNFPSSLLERANVLKNQMLSDEEKLMASLEKKERELKSFEYDLKLEEEKLKNELIKFQERLIEEASMRDVYLEEAKDKANAYLKEKENEIDKLYADMLELSKTAKINEAHKIREKLKAGTIKEKKKSNHVFKVKDNVRIENLNHIGEIISIDKNNVNVLVNGMSINTTLDKLEYVEVKRSKAKSKVVYNRPKKVSMELNILGKSVYEGISEVDKFLDNALLANLSSVVIIHGVGSGKLREGIINHLKTIKYVKSYKQAPPSNGGMGATIVYLK